MVSCFNKPAVHCVVIGLNNVRTQTNIIATGLRSPAYYKALEAVANYDDEYLDDPHLQIDVIKQQITDCLQSLTTLQIELQFLAAEITR